MDRPVLGVMSVKSVARIKVKTGTPPLPCQADSISAQMQSPTGAFTVLEFFSFKRSFHLFATYSMSYLMVKVSAFHCAFSAHSLEEEEEGQNTGTGEVNILGVASLLWKTTAERGEREALSPRLLSQSYSERYHHTGMCFLNTVSSLQEALDSSCFTNNNYFLFGATCFS